MNSHNGFLSYLQNSTANSAHLAAHFCPALIFPQKATVRIQFLLYFWNPGLDQVEMKNVVKCWKDFLSYFTTLETSRAMTPLFLRFICIVKSSTQSILYLNIFFALSTFSRINKYLSCLSKWIDKSLTRTLNV